MKFGYFVPNFMAGGIDITTLTGLAEVIDQRTAFDDLWVADHVVLVEQTTSRHPNFGRHVAPGTVEDFSVVGLGGMSASDPVHEPITLLSYLAGRTDRVHLGIGILIVPLRNPVVAAKMLAAVDSMSHGRLILATGTGWLREEYEALGAEWQGRGGRTDDYIACMRYLWSDRTDSFSSESVNINANVRMSPKPPRGAEIPIWVGGNSPPALRRAARIGTGWHGAQLSPVAAKQTISDLRELLDERNRAVTDFTMSLRLTCWLDDGGARTADDSPLVGSKSKLQESLEQYRDAGVQHIQFAAPPMMHIDALQDQALALDDLVAEFRVP